MLRGWREVCNLTVVMQSVVVTRPASSTAAQFLTYIAGIVIILNLLDALWTLAFVEAGVAQESNPLMQRALALGPVGFVVAKLTLVSLSVLLLWRLRHRRTAALALCSGAMTYALIVAYHVSNAHQLVLAAAR
jgi:hypothetical protein